MKKECSKCNSVFGIENFYQSGKDCFCKDCRKACRKEHYEKTKQHTKNKTKEYDKKNPDQLKQRVSKYVKKNQLAYLMYANLNYLNNKG